MEAWDKLGDRQYLNPEVKGLAVKVDSAKVKDIDVVSPFTGGSVFGHFWVIAETPTGVTIFMKFSTRLKPKISILKLGDGHYSLGPLGKT